MGDFMIVIRGVGGHGCQRTAKTGEVFHGCGYMSCPDCMATEFVKKLAEASYQITDATLTHWPVSMNATHGRSYTEASEVVDDLNYFTNIEGHGVYRNARMRKRIKGQFTG